MTLSRRNAIKYTLAATALGGLGTAAPPPKASADTTQFAVVNAKDYGATGDGTRDDTAALHAARDAAGVGGKIIVPPGNYIVSGLTANLSGQTWELNDGAIITMQPGTRRMLLITGAGVSLVGGVFDGSNGTSRDWSQNGIEVAADGVTIHNTTAQNSPVFGIFAFNRNQLSVSGCKLINNYHGGVFVQNTLTGPSDIYDISITDNLVESLAGQDANGIAVRGENSAHRVNRVTISRNTVRLPYRQRGETGGISIWNGVDWRVDYNVAVGGFMGITCPDSTRAAISNNWVHGFSEIGIEIPGGVNSVRIEHNVIDPDGTSATSGIQASAGTVDDLKILGNIIRNFSQNQYLISFVSDQILQNVTISGNSLTSTPGPSLFSGVYFNGSITGLAMSGNVVDAASRPKSWGVQFLKSASGVSIHQNLFSNISGGAILMAASGSRYTLDDINAVGNGVVNCGAILKDSTSAGAVVGTNIFA